MNDRRNDLAARSRVRRRVGSFPFFGLPFSLLLSVAAFVGTLALPAAHSTARAQSPEYTLSIGDVSLLPDQDRVLVPVHMTNPAPVQQWSMGLDYDDLLLNVISVTDEETVSEALSPAIIVGGNPGIDAVEVIYPLPTPLPAGVGQRVLWLEIQIIDPSAIPSGGSLVEIIAIANEPPSASIELTDGTVVTPDTQNGSVALYSPPVLRAGTGTGTPFDGEVQVPIEAWTGGPATTLEMGLDYDDLLLCEFTLDGSELQTLLGPDITATVSYVPWAEVQIVISAQNGAQIPLLDGETIGSLVYQVGPAALGYENLFAGKFAIDFVDGTCFVDSTEIDNTLSGSLEVEPEFIRGDVNFSGSVDAADIILILGHIFPPQANASLPPVATPLPCRDAADVNDDGSLNISDAIRLITYVFNVGPGVPEPPTAPFPDPGVDPTDDAIDCLGL